jgi:hypothetical protein
MSVFPTVFLAGAAPILIPTLKSNTSASTESGTSLGVTLPSDIAAGDLIWVSAGGIIVGGPSSWNLPSGYSQASGSSTATPYDFYKFASGTEGGTTLTLTWTGNAPVGMVVSIWAGCDTGTAPQAATSSSTSNPPPVSPAWGTSNTSLVIARTVVYVGGSGTAAITTWPSGYTDFQGSVVYGGSRCCAANAAKVVRTTSEDPSTYGVTGTSASFRSQTYAIKGLS